LLFHRAVARKKLFPIIPFSKGFGRDAPLLDKFIREGLIQIHHYKNDFLALAVFRVGFTLKIKNV